MHKYYHNNFSANKQNRDSGTRERGGSAVLLRFSARTPDNLLVFHGYLYPFRQMLVQYIQTGQFPSKPTAIHTSQLTYGAAVE
jgi:hypothetical protein